MKNLCKMLLIVALLAVGLQAATTIWVAPSDTAADWAESLNWSEGVPTSADTALLNNYGVIDVSAEGATCDTLSMGSSIDGGGTINVSDGSLTITTRLNMGRTTDCGDTFFNLSGGQFNAGSTELGWRGPGVSTFNQTGGEYINQGNLVMARTAGAVASYTISGGTLSTNILYVGIDGQAKFSVVGDGSTININGIDNAFRVYGDSVLETVIDPNVSTINVANGVYFAEPGVKWNVYANNALPGRYEIIKAGSIVGISNVEVSLPNNHWSWGLDGGTLWVEYDNTAFSTAWIGEEGNPISWSSTSHWSYGEPEITDTAYINNHRTVKVEDFGEACNNFYMGSDADAGGTVDMTDGSLTIADAFWMGRTNGSGDNYFNLSGGELNAVKTDIGIKPDCGLSAFTQTGGTFTSSSFIMIAREGLGSYVISGGEVYTPTLYISSNGEQGTFEVDGGGADINFDSIRIYETGTVVSRIGTDGISVINVSGAARLESPNATWNVINDGAIAGRYDLMTAGSYVGFSNLTLNLPTDEWSWGITNGTVWVEYAPEINIGYLYPGLPCQMTIDITIPGTSANEITLSYGQDTLDNSVVVAKDLENNNFVYTFTDLKPGKQYIYQIDDGGSLFTGNFSAESILPDTFIIEDFEQFSSTQDLVDNRLIYPYGSTQSLITEPNAVAVYEGNKCVQYQSTGGYFYSGLTFNGIYSGYIDLSGYDKLRIWYKGDAQNQENISMMFDIRCLDYTNSFIVEDAPVNSDYDKWTYQDFDIDSSDPNWADVRAIYLRVNSSSQTSTIYLDRIEAVRETVIGGDYNGDLTIDEIDLGEFISLWLTDTDLVDFSQLAYIWLSDYSCGSDDWSNVYISPDGNGNGISPFSAASLYDQGLWSRVNVALRDYPVTVWLLDGVYDESQELLLERIGNDTNTLTIKAKNPGGVVFNPQSPLTDYVIYLRHCQNVVLDGLEFTGSNVINYSLALNYSSQISVINCNFYDLTATEFGVFGAHRGCDDILVQNCTFERCGVNSLSHLIYNAYGDPTNINIDSCNFEDCSGSYVRFRDGGNGSSVTNCTFTSTGTYPQPSRLTYIQMATFNDRDPEDIAYDEYLGTNFTFTGNTFDFTNVATQDKRSIDFLHHGYDPRGDNPNTSDGDNQWHYLMTAADGAILEGSDASAKRTLLYNECGIDYNQLNISSNTYIGQTIILGFESKAEYGAVSQGWDSIADITDILN